MAYDLGPKIGIDGEAEFRKQITDITTGLKTMGTEMKVVTTEFIGQENSEKALTAQNQVLGKTVTELSSKLELQKKMLAESASAFGEADSRTQKWQQAVNNTQAELNKANAQIKANENAMKGLGTETESLGNSMDTAAQKSVSFSDILKANLLSDVIKSGIHALGEGLKNAIGALSDAAYAADDLNTLAKQTGLSTEELQKFQYATNLIDVPLETLTGSMTKLTRNMATASKGTGDAAKAFDKLGVNIQNQDGSLRDRNEVFRETIDALGKMSNETERDALAMNIFGKSAQDLNPLILGGADALEALGNEAEQAGVILSQDSLNSLNLVSDSLDRMKATTANMGGLFLSQFAEPLAGGLESVTAWLQRLTGAFSEGGLEGLTRELSAVAKEMTAVLAEKLPEAVNFGAEIISSLGAGILSQLPQIMEAAIQILSTLVSTLSAQLPTLIPAAVDMILTLVTGLLDNLDDLVDPAISIILALAEGLINALPTLIEKAPVIIAKLVTALVENAPKLLTAAVSLIGSLVTGIIGALPQLGQAAGDIITTLVTGVLELGSALLNVGGQIVSGIWQGIKDKAGWFKDQITGFFTGIVDGVKDVLGIESPSRVFAGIGKYMAEGLGVGWDKEYKDIKRGIEDGLSFDAGTVSSNLTVPGITAPGSAFNPADLLSGMVNGVQTALVGAGSNLPQSATIVLQAGDGTTIARWLLPDLRAAMRDDPEPALT